LLLQAHRVVLGCRQDRLDGLEVVFDGRRIGTCYTSCVKDRSLAPLTGELLRREENLELVLLPSNILLAAEARLILGEGFSKRLLRVEAVVELGVVLLELFDVPVRVEPRLLYQGEGEKQLPHLVGPEPLRQRLRRLDPLGVGDDETHPLRLYKGLQGQGGVAHHLVHEVGDLLILCLRTALGFDASADLGKRLLFPGALRLDASTDLGERRLFSLRSEEHTSELSHVKISYAVFC